MIVGTGVDLCEVPRIRKAIESSHGQRLIERVFTEREIAYAQRKANPYERYAARFAAKEAGMRRSEPAGVTASPGAISRWRICRRVVPR
jgi:holo-[acyl-carrier protein] synthase